MKVNVVVEPDLEEEYVEIHVKGITDEIPRLLELIQNKSQAITGMDEYERIVVIEESNIVALHADKKWCRIYTDTSNYSCRKRSVDNHIGAYAKSRKENFVYRQRKM